MEKYVCVECGEVFDKYQAKYYEERDTGEGGYGNVMYSAMLCPVCGSEDIDDAKLCPVCGEWHGREDDIICEDCAKDIEMAWKELLDKFSGGADEYEIARYISEVLL